MMLFYPLEILTTSLVSRFGYLGVTLSLGCVKTFIKKNPIPTFLGANLIKKCKKSKMIDFDRIEEPK